MKKCLCMTFVCILLLSFSAGAFAYPNVGTDPIYTLSDARSSGAFTNYHFPNRYYKGVAEGTSFWLTKTTKSNVALQLETFYRDVSLGNGAVWQGGPTLNYNTSELGYGLANNFVNVTTRYYCFRLTKTAASGSMTVGYKLDKFR